MHPRLSSITARRESFTPGSREKALLHSAISRHAAIWLLLYGMLIAVLALPLSAQRPETVIDLGLDSLLRTRIDAASKYAQTSAEAPASITIVTGDEIRLNGYRNMHEILESVRGFYVSNDRNYPSVGTRGFSRPSDYNNRILLLIDGHSVNEPIWGGAPMGSDLPINLRAIERIEIVRGPGSALYGSSAMFGVINIVTKTGIALDGVVVGASAGSGQLRQGDVVAGHALGTRGSVAVSGSLQRSDGKDLYYAEYDNGVSDGFARGLDWEDAMSTFATLTWADVTARAGYLSRSKGVPTGAFEMAFGDPRAETKDAYSWVELAWRRALSGSSQFSARLNADRYQYIGSYPQGPEGVYSDNGSSQGVGGEAMVLWDPASNHRLTLGSEFRHVSQAHFHELQVDGSLTQDDAPFDVASLFVQSEFQLHPRMSFTSGLRLDKKSSRDATLAPRVALLVTPDKATTVKLLFGEAFRSPSVAEADMTTSFYTRNTSLRPERIRTLELEMQRRVATPLLFTVSLFDYRIKNLIEQELSDNGGLEFRNVASAHAQGAELEVDLQPEGPIAVHAAYALQGAHDETSEERMTNSPAQVSRVTLTGRLAPGLRSATTVRFESGRRTLAGTSTGAFVRTDVSLLYTAGVLGAWARGADLSLRVANVFNKEYASPGGVEHLQAFIPADGRALSLALHWRY